MKYSTLLLLLICPTLANAQNFTAGPSLSTLGAGLEGGYKFSDNLVLRGTINYATFDESDDIDGVDYDVDATLKSFGLIGDYHPFANGFRLSAGVRYSGNEADVEASPTESVTIGNTTYTPAEIGTLDGDVEFEKFAPYLGIGYNNALFGNSAISFHFDLGLHYQGDAKVNLNASEGTLAANQAFQDDVERERQEIEDDLDVLGFYPVIALGLSIRF